MFPLLKYRAAHYLLLALVSAILFLPNLGVPSLWDIDEGNNLECSREMLESGNWVVPTFNYVLRVDKPALLYWLQIAAYKALGVGEGAGRLPSALAALLAVLLTYELGRRLFDPPTGLLGGLILASSPLYCAAGHFANPDALLSLCTLLTFIFFWQAIQPRPKPKGTGASLLPEPKPTRQQARRGPLLLAGVASGLAVLAKGPVGLVLPLAAGLLYLVWSRRLGILWSKSFLLSCLVFVLVMSPWYAWVAAETKAEFLSGFFLKHNVNRYLSPMENHGGGLYYYPLVLLVGMAPWSAFFLPAGWFAFGRRGREDSHPTSPENGLPAPYRYLWCWMAVYLLFFSLAGTKLPNYILPSYPALALLTGRFLERWRRGSIQVPGWVLAAGLSGFALAGVVFALCVLIVGGVIPGLVIPRCCFPGMGIWSVLGGILVLGALVSAWFLLRRRREKMLAALGSAAVLFLAALAAGGVDAVEANKAPRPLAAALFQAQEEPDIRLAAFQYFSPSLVFYCRRQIGHLASPESVIEYLLYPTEVYLFLPAREWERLQPLVPVPCRLVAQHHDLYRNCQVVLVANKPKRINSQVPDQVGP